MFPSVAISASSLLKPLGSSSFLSLCSSRCRSPRFGPRQCVQALSNKALLLKVKVLPGGHRLSKIFLLLVLQKDLSLQDLSHMCLLPLRPFLRCIESFVRIRMERSMCGGRGASEMSTSIIFLLLLKAFRILVT